MIMLFGLGVYWVVVITSSAPATIAICVPILAVLLFVLPLRLVLLPKRIVGMSRELVGTINVYQFTDYGVTVQSTSQTAISHSNVNYAHFQIVYETEAFFFLFIGQLRAYIIKKSDITNGDSNNLQWLLRMNTPPDRYHIRHT
jgi:hypothetical protein